MDYSKILSKNVQEIQPSGIRKFFDIAAEMKDIVSLTVGEPDFVTPRHIREVAIKSLEDGETHYTSNTGMTVLRKEIANYLDRRFSTKYDPLSELIVTVGGSEAIDISIRSIVNPGDEVIVALPAFVCYTPLVSMAGGIPVPIHTEEKDKFKLTPEALKAAITPKTKMLIMSYPSNPTGAYCRDTSRNGYSCNFGRSICRAYLRQRPLLCCKPARYARKNDTRKRFFQSICHDRLENGIRCSARTPCCSNTQAPSVCYHVRSHNQSVRRY